MRSRESEKKCKPTARPQSSCWQRQSLSLCTLMLRDSRANAHCPTHATRTPNRLLAMLSFTLLQHLPSTETIAATAFMHTNSAPAMHTNFVSVKRVDKGRRERDRYRNQDKDGVEEEEEEEEEEGVKEGASEPKEANTVLAKAFEGSKELMESSSLESPSSSSSSSAITMAEDGSLEAAPPVTGNETSTSTPTSAEPARTPLSPPTTSNRVSSQWAVVGSSITFRAEATGGNPPPRFQWRRNGIDVEGENDFLLSIDDVQPEDAGTYTCLIFNEAGGTEWEEAVLHIGTPPVVEDQWQTYRLVPGAKLTIRALNARGMPLPSFQWRHNGVDVPGATSSAFTVSSASQADDGTYTCVVFNLAGSTIWEEAIVHVSPEHVRVVKGQDFGKKQ